MLTIIACAVLISASWFGIKASIALYEFNDALNVSLARDTKTNAYLGEVLSESRDPQSEKVQSYRIKRNDGSIVERSADTVIVFKP
ncbi:MAG TPA: hypothetical protein VLJ61_08290 [Pyrinomonadaceae bacterium]|nr:hypothetical protein [Pyrinomonadaceae bacterium]